MLKGGEGKQLCEMKTKQVMIRLPSLLYHAKVCAVSKLIFWLLHLAIIATHASVTSWGNSTSWSCTVALYRLSQK